MINGIHHVKIPVTDLARSREWYERALGFRVEMEFRDDDGVVRGVAGDIGGAGVALRVDPDVAKALAGFDPVCFAADDLERYGAPGRGSVGQVIALRDPDGIEVRLYNNDRKGLDGKVFRSVGDNQGEVDAGTLFTYHEQDGEIWAEYGGGQIKRGHLVGTRDGDRLDFRYSQLNTAGETSTGHCVSIVETLPDGRLRLNETWRWESREGSGTGVVEEVPPRSRA